MPAGPELADHEIVALESQLSRGLWLPSEVPAIYAKIAERRERVRAGIALAPAYWTKRLQEQVDPLLRLRWEYADADYRNQGHWVVDRWVAQDGCWVPVAVGVMLEDRLIDILKEGDLQRLTDPMKRLEEKRTRARIQREINDKANTAKIDAAIDSMTVKQQMEFVQVEEAIAAGETITAKGDDNRILSKMQGQARKQYRPIQSVGLGARFKKLKRKLPH
jgi:hypothetical protein